MEGSITHVGDIAILSDENFVSLRVDGEVILTIPRSGHGLDDLASILKDLVK